ncbi:HupE/UreJ family protein [Riemerella columbina]|uniref:HupE/UreJ family protein n=1 Tax=Riemerella columbina TaxID=103810 RepID=UPI00266F3D11|nr:HupE/UreJ family protein [Riemerella columbina]WKS96079.1 HupE/UreJ family protein [Riemerella columbina]
MSDFLFYLQLGWEHIISTDALDHQLFIWALVIVYTIKDFKSLLILVTAFTIGHSLTLVLSVLDVVRLSSAWVEFLIPCTIMLTALDNIIFKNQGGRRMWFNYLLALSFGFIHGMGFANTVRMMLAQEQSIGIPLLGFNIGLELGQLAAVAIIILIDVVMIKGLKIPRSWWVKATSLIVFLWAATMAWERLPF